MKLSIMLVLACAVALQAQPPQGAPPGVSGEVKQAYTNVKNNFLKAADKMPEEGYSFKATPDLQDFGQRIAHIADANARTCGAIKGEQKALGAASKKTKADLVAALKESFDYCDPVFNGLTDADATTVVTMGRGQRSKIGALWGTVSHTNELYGYISVYLRLKGIVPPSSEPR